MYKTTQAEVYLCGREERLHKLFYCMQPALCSNNSNNTTETGQYKEVDRKHSWY
jgi:hypothetical protein